MKKILETLPEAERKAIEWHGRGYNYHWIAQNTGTAYETVKGWFKKRGKLYRIYEDYIKARNAKFQQFTNIQLGETAENIINLDRKLMAAYNSHMMGGLSRFRMKDIEIAAKLKSLVLGKPLLTKVYGPDNKPLTETEKDIKIKKLEKIIDTMAAVWDKATKEAVKKEFASMEGLVGFF
jgi:hypothetical protein